MSTGIEEQAHNTSIGQRLQYALAQHEKYYSAILLAFIAALTYGLLIPWLGIYWDEWIFIWVANIHGPSGLIDAMTSDRPALGYLWAAEYGVFGNNILLWHILALVMRIGSGIAALWLFRELLPKYRSLAFIAGLLFTIYPGFLQQPIGFMYQLTFIVLILSNVSLAASVRAQKAVPKRMFWVGLALITLFLELILVEYYLGLEFLRLLLLWHLAGDVSSNIFNRHRIMFAIRRFVPYLALSFSFLIWRVFFFSSVRGDTDINEAIRPENVLLIPFNFLQDFFETVIFAWFVPINQMWKMAGVKGEVVAFFVAASCMSMVAVYLYQLQKVSSNSDLDEIADDPSKILSLMLVGLLAFPASVSLVLISGRGVSLVGFSDRYTLVALMPTVILVSTVSQLISHTKLRLLFIALLVGISVNTHFLNANLYRSQWLATNDLWWQITWRIPQIEDDTMLIIEADTRITSVSSDGFTLLAPANLIYRDNSEPPAISANFLSTTTVNLIRRHFDDHLAMRTIDVPQKFSNPLVIVYREDSCLRVIDAARLEMPQEPSGQLLAVSTYSQIDRIITNNEQMSPPAFLFGSEPTHNWCYYFQKADLARQTGNYVQVVDLMNEAKHRNFAPNDVTEWYPLIESYVVLGRIDEASSLIEIVLTEDELFAEDICRMLERLGKDENYDIACPHSWVESND